MVNLFLHVFLVANRRCRRSSLACQAEDGSSQKISIRGQGGCCHTSVKRWPTQGQRGGGLTTFSGMALYYVISSGAHPFQHSPQCTHARAGLNSTKAHKLVLWGALLFSLCVKNCNCLKKWKRVTGDSSLFEINTGTTDLLMRCQQVLLLQSLPKVTPTTASADAAELRHENESVWMCFSKRKCDYGTACL